MSSVIVNKDKLDILANAISVKSGESVPMTLAEMVEAVDGIETGGGVTITETQDSHGGTIVTITTDGDVTPVGPPTLQTKTATYTPTESQQTATITADSGYDGLDEVDITVGAISSTYVGSGVPRRSTADAVPDGPEVVFPAGYYASEHAGIVQGGSAGTPTATKGTVSNHSISVTPSVTNSEGWISSGTKTGTAVSVSASELVSGTLTISASGTHNVTNYASASVASGGATASATKGTVSNHSVTVTPSVTRTAGYVTAGTASGTGVTVSASELVSGSQTVTENGTVDVTNLAEIVVAVEGGGGGEIAVGRKTTTLASTASSIQFTGLSGNPTSFAITSAGDVATNTNGVTMVVFDGSTLHGQTMTTQVEASTAFTKSYSNGTLTVTASSASFRAVQYKLVYTYGGTSSDIHTSDVQVGSGATSITFSGLSGNPTYWSCIFKSNFSTSSGYQRVIGVVNDGSSIYGMDMDSSAHAASSWSASYSSGALTISSQSTNVGGYFHQPGYYQLTYAVGDSAPQYQTKSVSITPSTSQQTQTVTPDSGYDALEAVNITVSAVQYSTIYNGSTTPSSSLGVDGDIYLKT